MPEFWVVFRTKNRVSLEHSRRKISAINEKEAIRIAAGQYDTTPGHSPYDKSTAYNLVAIPIEEDAE